MRLGSGELASPAAQAPAGAAGATPAVAEGRAAEAKPSISIAAGDRLDAVTLYGILRLRAEVFVVEQACPYLDPDGRDLEPDTLHLWMEDGDRVAAALRVTAEEAGVRRIGRVATAPSVRGRGLASALVRRAVELIGDAPAVLHAQAHLEAWYRQLGFAPSGPGFVEDGIPHVPMRRG